MFCNWSNWSGLLQNFLSTISCLTTCSEHSRAWNVGFFVLDMCTCNALFKHFTVLSAYCLFYDIQVRPNRSAALHVHVVYLHCASWVICSLPKTPSGQCNLNSRVDQKIKHVYILCMYTVNAHKLFCRFKSECSMPPRRNRIPNEVRRRIVRAFEDPTYQSLTHWVWIGALPEAS